MKQLQKAHRRKTMWLKVYTFIDVMSGLVVNEEATLYEDTIEKIEGKWLKEHGYMEPGMSLEEARQSFEDAMDKDDDYYIFCHALADLEDETTTESPEG